MKLICCHLRVKPARVFYTVTNCLMHSTDNLVAVKVNQRCMFNGVYNVEFVSAVLAGFSNSKRFFSSDLFCGRA